MSLQQWSSSDIIPVSDFLGSTKETGDFLSADEIQVPLSPEYASEMATAASLVHNDDDTTRQSMEDNLAITGKDQRVATALADSSRYVQNLKQQKLIETGSPEELAAGLPQLAKPRKATDADLITAAAVQMVDSNQYVQDLKEREDLGDRLGQLTSWVGKQRELNNILNNYEERLSEDTSWKAMLGDFAEALAPIYSPIAERTQRESLTDGGMKDFLLRSGGTDEVASAILNAPEAQQADMLLALLDTVEEAETLIGNKNSLFTFEIIADIRNKINDGVSQAGSISSATVLSELVGTIDYLEIGSAKAAIKFLLNKAVGKNNVASAVESTFPSRSGKGSLLDAVAHEDATAAQQYLAVEDIEAIAKKMGNTTEEVIDRVMPRPQGQMGELGLKGDFLERDPSILLTDLEQKNIAGNVARKLEKSSGNAAEARLELSETFTPDTEGSMGGLLVRMGSKDENGFTYEEALSASHNFVGDEVQLVKREGNGFVPAQTGDADVFLEVKQEVFFDPKRDAGLSELEGGVVGGFRDNKYLLNPWRRFDGKILGRYFAGKSIDRGLQSKFASDLKPIQRLLGADSENFNNLVRMGDSSQAVFSKQQARTLLNGDLTDKTWEAYKSFTAFQDDLYRLETVAHRRSLDQQGFKYINVGDTEEFVRPILKPKYSKKPSDDVSTLHGKAYDAESGEILELSQEVIDQVYNSGGIIGKSRGTKAIGDEEFSQLVIRSRDNVQSLPAQTLNKRKGYYARFYGETGYLVTRAGKKILNGAEMDRRDVVGIFPDSKSARDFIAANGDDTMQAVFSRESNEYLQGLGGVTEFGWQPINQRKRGQELQGPQGNPARTLDPMESLAKQYDSVERKLGRDYNELMRERWTKQYTPLLRNEYKGKFPSEYSNDIFDPDALKNIDNVITDDGKDIFREAKSWHDHIRTAEGVRDEPLFANFNRSLQLHIERLVAKDKPVQAAAYKVLDKTLSKADLKTMATYFFIIGRPLFQVPTNMLQLSYLVARSPVSGSVTVAQTVPFGMAIAARNTKAWKTTKGAMAKAFDMDAVEFERMVDGFVKSGLNNPKLSDDFIRYTRASYKDAAKTVKRSAIEKYGNPMALAGNASRDVQAKSIMYANMGGYIQSYKEKKAALGRAPVTAKERGEILADSDLLLQSQNSIDEFAFQERNNPVSFMFQFMQHVTKLWYDMILDPSVKLMTGKSVGKNPSKFADTRSQAAITLTGIFSMYGLQGMVGQEWGVGASDNLRRMAEQQGLIIDDESWDWFRGGMINVLVDSFIDGEVNVTGRITPSGVVDAVVHQMLDDPFALEWMGASGASLDIFSTAARTVGAFAVNPELAVEDKMIGAMADVARIFAGIDDVYKAHVAYQTGLAMTGSDSPIAEVTKDEAILRAFSFRSWDEVYSNMERSDRFNRQDYVKRTGDIWVRWVNVHLANSQGASLDEQLRMIREDLMPVVYASTKEGLGDDVIAHVRNRMLNERDLLGNRINQALQFTTHKQALKNLELLKQRGVGDPESIQFQIDTLRQLMDTDLKVK